MKVDVTIAVFRRLRASPATANNRAAFKMLSDWMAMSSRMIAAMRIISDVLAKLARTNEATTTAQPAPVTASRLAMRTARTAAA